MANSSVTLQRFLKHFFMVLALCLAATGTAHAKKGLMLINTGDELFTVAPFPEDVIKEIPKAKDANVGYKCDHFGIFWADIWTWNCKIVAVLDENSYADLPDNLVTRLAGDEKFAMSHAKRGFWNHYAFPGLLIAVGVFVAWSMISGIRKKEQADDAGAQPA